MRLRNRYAIATGLLLIASQAAMAQSEGHKWTSPLRASEPREIEPDPAARAVQGPFAILIRNADIADGKPPFALVDQYGEVQRYIEPSPGIELASHVGTRIRVKHDTGETLLASQLDLPNEMQPLLRTRQHKRPQANRNQGHSVDNDQGVVAAQFDADPGSAANDRMTPLADGASSDSAEPIVLEDMLRDEADSLPAPNRRHSSETLEPIVGEEILPYGGDYEPNQHTHGPDCPHCNKKSHSAPIETGVSSCDCDRCQAKRARSYRTTSHKDHAWSGCSTCGRSKGWCGPTCCPPSQRGVYARADYLMWWFKGMETPALVTAGTQTSEGVLGRDGTTTLFGGNNDLLDNTRNGLRLTVGAWLDDCRDFAIEGDWIFTETESVGYSAGDATGASVISRPFFNLTPMDGNGNLLGPAEDAELVSFPNTVAGTVSVRARSQFESGGLRLRTGLCCRELGCGGGCGDTCGSSCGSCVGDSCGGKSNGIARIDFIGGYRYASLEESLTIEENLTSLITVEPGQFYIRDQFATDNEFHGVDLGFMAEWESCRWGVELASKIALGNTRQRVRINGTTTVSDQGVSVTDTGGLLALDSNIGSYARDRFSVLPELSARLNYRVTPRVRLSAGYTLIYWANVVRPGDQIDVNVDTRGLSPQTTTVARPAFAFHETSLWTHGLNFGIDCNY